MKILCGTDFSDPAGEAALLAGHLASRWGDTLVLANAWNPAPIGYPIALVPRHPDYSEQFEKQSEEGLTAAAAKLGAAGLTVELRPVRGIPSNVLSNLAREIDVRLVVVGTHGRRGLAGALLGSVATETVLLSRRPVLVARGRGSGFAGWARRERPLKVLVGLDGSVASRGAIACAAQLLQAGDCELRFVHFYSPDEEARRLGIKTSSDIDAPNPGIVGVLEDELYPMIESLPCRVQGALAVRPCLGSVAAALCSEASSQDADLLMMGTHQRSGLAQLRLGSTVQPVLRAATLPVLCVPTSQAPAQEPRPLPELRNLLVATDLSELGNQAVAAAYGLLGGRAGHIVLCHVPKPHGETVTDDDKRSIRFQMGQLIPRQATGDVHTDIVVTDGGSPAEKINQIANRMDADAIVLASHGRGAVARAVLGSVAAVVVEKAERPVMVVRSRS